MKIAGLAKVVSLLCALCGAGAALAVSAGSVGTGVSAPSVGPTSAVLPSIEILPTQSHLGGTCGGATFDLNTFINVDAQASGDVRLSVPGAGTIEQFTDETGSNVGPFKGTYSAFHILSFGGGLPPDTPILLSITTYTGHGLAGKSTFVSTLLFDCTTGTILNVSGNAPGAAAPIPVQGDAMLVAMAGALAALGALALRRRKV